MDTAATRDLRPSISAPRHQEALASLHGATGQRVGRDNPLDDQSRIGVRIGPHRDRPERLPGLDHDLSHRVPSRARRRGRACRRRAACRSERKQARCDRGEHSENDSSAPGETQALPGITGEGRSGLRNGPGRGQPLRPHHVRTCPHAGRVEPGADPARAQASRAQASLAQPRSGGARRQAGLTWPHRGRAQRAQARPGLCRRCFRRRRLCPLLLSAAGSSVLDTALPALAVLACAVRGGPVNGCADGAVAIGSCAASGPAIGSSASPAPGRRGSASAGMALISASFGRTTVQSYTRST